MALGVCQARGGQRAEAERSLARLRTGRRQSGRRVSRNLLYQRGEYQRAQFYIRRLNNSELANAETLWLRHSGGAPHDRVAIGGLAERLKICSEVAALERGAFDECRAMDAGGRCGAGRAGRACCHGSLLREAREAAGLHIAALAVSLKVPVRKLEALEAEPATTCCRRVRTRPRLQRLHTLKVDPAPVLERFHKTAAPRLAHDEGGINSHRFGRPVMARAVPGSTSCPSRFFWRYWLLLGALVLIFLPAAQRGGDASRAWIPTTAAAPAGPATAPPAQAPVGEPVVTSPPLRPRSRRRYRKPAPVQAPQTTVAVTPSVKPPALSPGLSVAVSDSHGGQPDAGADPGSASPAAVPAPLPTTGVLVFKTRGESWVE